MSYMVKNNTEVTDYILLMGDSHHVVHSYILRTLALGSTPTVSVFHHRVVPPLLRAGIMEAIMALKQMSGTAQPGRCLSLPPPYHGNHTVTK